MLVLVLVAGVCSSIAAAESGSGSSIAAVVGEEAISSFDVENRIKFVVATTRLSSAPEAIARIRPQVIRALIDERLQLREAAGNDIAISEQDINEAIQGLEAQRGMPPGTISRMLTQNNIPKETFTKQIEAQLAWSKLLGKKVRPRVRISEEDIALAGQQAAVPVVKQEYNIALITLPVDKKSREQEVRAVAEKLVNEIQTGASFEEVARQFSSSSARESGKLDAFWVRPEQLDPVIGKALAGVTKGSITPPIRTDGGYTIIKIYDTRALEQTLPGANVTLKEILLRLKPGAPQREADALLAIGEEVAKHPGTCEEKGVAGVENFGDLDMEINFHTTPLSDLSPAVKVIVQGLAVGGISTPFASSEGIRLFMLCDKKQASSSEPDKERIFAQLMKQRMELEAQKYMRNLRRDAFIEIR